MNQSSIFLDHTPELFTKHGSHEKFTHCTMCHTNLFDSDQPYIIEKAIKKYKGFTVTDVIYEYAICMNCSAKFQEKISVESQNALAAFYMQALMFQKSYTGNPEEIYEQRLSKCMIKNTPVDELDEFQIAGIFVKDKLLLNDSPMIISAEGGEEMNELLSAQTRDEFDQFKKHITAPPPEFEELFKRKIVFI